MEQFNLTDAERNGQELSEEDLVEVSGGGFLHDLKSVGRVIKSAGKGFGRVLGGEDVFVTPGFGNVRYSVDVGLVDMASCFLRTGITLSFSENCQQILALNGNASPIGTPTLAQDLQYGYQARARNLQR